MLSRRIFSHLAFFLVGVMSLLLAVYLASKFLTPARSQDQGAAPAIAPAESAPSASATPPPPAPSPAPPPAQVAEGEVPNEMADPGIVPINDNVSFLEPYVFDLREGRRNPFRAPTLADGTLADVMLPGTPLERYDLNELKLVGIMWDIHTPKAMLVDPQGEVHVLGKDDRIGRKRGYIAVIREGEVVVVETSTFNGENAYATRVMRIDK